MRITSAKHEISARALAVAFAFAALVLVSWTDAAAYQIETLPDMPVSNDFVVGPGKRELFLNPGDARTVNLTVTNRMGEEKTFQIEVEDFVGSRDVKQTVVLLGDSHGPYSLKDYVSVPEYSFTLKHGERATVPVTVSVPADAEPGGKYGSVIVSTATRRESKQAAEGASGGATIISRIGTLFFVTVNGDVAKGGSLNEFTLAQGKRFYVSGPIGFHLVFENTGTTHLNPYGEIRIRNMFGEEVGEVIVEPWFSLPNSLRLREASWERGTLFGMYTATAKINRGYDDIIDEKTVKFFVFPWKIALAAFAALALVILFFRMVFTRFEIKRK